MATRKLRRPDDDDYYAAPWSEQVLQGDIFDNVPIGFAAPPDAIVVPEGEQRFITGPFDAGPAMLISPSCAIASQGPAQSSGPYGHPARILIPIRPVEELLEVGRGVTQENVALLRLDRLVNFLYLPAGEHGEESAGLLYMPVTMHHDVIAGSRVSQLTGSAFWHLRVKLMAFYGRFLLDPSELGPVPGPTERES